MRRDCYLKAASKPLEKVSPRPEQGTMEKPRFISAVFANIRLYSATRIELGRGRETRVSRGGGSERSELGTDGSQEAAGRVKSWPSAPSRTHSG